ncbi:MAG: glycoside-pentoside-hexuronide (GPH):cation symporter [Treponema sp.]|jgi:GPH family glycoside/pentoside/hexuronide:cation symporter|nr:glycoside-pentoside-hexuronide (GPH):cation symporter [Treponema sp.]
METNRKPGSGSLSLGQKLGFGIFDLGGNLFFTLMGFWCLKYLTDTAGLTAGLAGIALMIGKAWDAVTDPVMGYISDRTRSRWGRRRPYLLFGALPMLLSMWFFFSAPSFSGQTALTLWALLALILLNTAATVINIPYSSLTPELTTDYHERSALNGYRFGCAVFGTIIGAAAVQPLTGLFASPRLGWSMTGLILGALMALTTLLTFAGTREKAHTAADYPTEGFFATYREVFKNGPYVRLLLTYALHIMGITFLQSILPYYTEYVYGRPDLTTPALGILLLSAMAFIPVSVLVSRKIGKKRTYQICFAVISSACLAVFFFGQAGGIGGFLALMGYAGVGVGFSYVAPYAMIPDAIDYGAAKAGGNRKEGAYYGIWTFVSKLGTALSVFVSGGILALGGYRANMEQGSGAVTAIRLLAGPVPALILAGAMALIGFYTLDRKIYGGIQDRKQ